MLMTQKTRTAADYRLQAAHIREFLKTVHSDDQLRTVLLDAAARFERLAAEAERSDSMSASRLSAIADGVLLRR
jgi:hypothetical protein